MTASCRKPAGALLRQDLDASLPALRACGDRLVVIPASCAEEARLADRLRDGETLARLRRVHHAFGDLLRHEHASRAAGARTP